MDPSKDLLTQSFEANIGSESEAQKPFEDTVVLESQDPYIGKIFGACRLIGRVGAGAVGVVYLAQHLRLERHVAVKLLAKGLETQDDIRQRFLMEGKILAQLEHPNIVRIYDLGEEHNQLYLILHFIDGETLEKRLRTKGKLSEIETVNIFIKVLAGLAHVHQNGLVHRDLKPQNIMLGQDLGVFLMDFSVAQFSSIPFRLTYDGAILGTPYFMAPEQIEGKRGDHRMDLYAVGMSMYVSLTGSHPFLSKTLIETMQRQLYEDVPPLADIHPELSTLISALLQRDPQHRPKNCEEVIGVLSQWLASTRSQEPEEKAESDKITIAPKEISPDLEQAFSEEEGLSYVSTSPNLKLIEKIRALSTLGEYRLEKEMGEGQWGLVYRVRHLKSNQVYAIKILTKITDVNALERFHQEIQACAKLSHPNIVRFRQSESDRGFHYFVMEYIDGLPLSKKISERSLSIRETVRIIYECLQGLAYAHSKGVLHRDLKPENILLDSHLSPKLADFGISRDLSKKALKSRITQDGAILGTPAYMPPEQVMGIHEKIDFRSDLYSMAACLYEMVTYRHPFEAENLQQLFYRICNEDVLPPSRWNPEVHRDLETILLKGLQKDPERRYQNAETFALDLERFLNGLPILARPETRMLRFRKWSKKHKSLVSLGGFLALIFFSSSLLVHQKVLVLLSITLTLFFISLLLILQYIQLQREILYQASHLFFERIKDRAKIINEYLAQFKQATETLASLNLFFLQHETPTQRTPWIQNATDEFAKLPEDYKYSEPHQKQVSFQHPICFLAPEISQETVLPQMKSLLSLTDYFQSLTRTGLEFSFIYSAMESGFLLGYPGMPIEYPKFDPRKRSWYVQAQKSEGTVWVHPYPDAEDQGMTLSCATALRQKEKCLGVVGIDITEDTFKKKFLRFPLLFPSFRGIYNLEGQILCAIYETQFPQLNPLPLPTPGESLVRFQHLYGEKFVICYSWVKTLDCFLVVAARESDILRTKTYAVR